MPNKKLTVGNFFSIYASKLLLEPLSDLFGMDRLIEEPTINRPGLALAGFFCYFASKRIQAAGLSELSYLDSLSPEECSLRVEHLFKQHIPCLIISRSLLPPAKMLDHAKQTQTPVFSTSLITMKFINAATIALEDEFSPNTLEHGSMVDILGIGVLIRGSSGIGKSECVLGLIERGYSLVSDDITRIKIIEGRTLIGESKKLTRFHMEVRGIGIIDVASIFGIGSVRDQKTVDLVVTLKDWGEMEDDIERIGIDRATYEILDIKIPHVIIPVKTGRDLARLVEVAALDQKLKSMGHNSAYEFNKSLIQAMQSS